MRGITAGIVTLYIDFTSYFSVTAISALLLNSLRTAVLYWPKDPLLFLLYPSLLPLFFVFVFLLNLFLIVGTFISTPPLSVVFFLERGTMSLEEYFVFAGEGDEAKCKQIVDSVNMCIILLKHVQQTVR